MIAKEFLLAYRIQNFEWTHSLCTEKCYKSERCLNELDRNSSISYLTFRIPKKSINELEERPSKFELYRVFFQIGQLILKSQVMSQTINKPPVSLADLNFLRKLTYIINESLKNSIPIH